MLPTQYLSSRLSPKLFPQTNSCLQIPRSPILILCQGAANSRTPRAHASSVRSLEKEEAATQTSPKSLKQGLETQAQPQLNGQNPQHTSWHRQIDNAKRQTLKLQPESDACPALLQYVPREINIKNQWQRAEEAARNTDAAHIMQLYARRIDGHFDNTSHRLDPKHISGALYGTARIWQAIQTNPSQRAQHDQHAQQDLEAFLLRMLLRLQRVMPQAGTRIASNAFWVFAQLGVNPDSLSPGVVDALGLRFMSDIHAATGQSVSSTMLACVDLQLNPCQGQLLKTMQTHLETASMAIWDGQSLSSTAFALAKLRAQPSAQLMDRICACFLGVLKSPVTAKHVNGQDVSSFAWALQDFKHMPSGKLLQVMLFKMVYLCKSQKHQPAPVDTSLMLFTCAVLRAKIKPEAAQVMTNQLLHHRQLQPEDVSVTAWALAVLGLLTLDVYSQLLHSLEKLGLQVPSKLSAGNTGRMYPALDRLEVLATSQDQQMAWSQMQHRLQMLGPRPIEKAMPRPCEPLLVALALLGLRCQSNALVKSYWVNAVVQPRQGTAAAILILVGGQDTFKNKPARFTGRAIFCEQLLSQAGIPLFVSFKLASGDPEQLAKYLKPRLEAAAGGSLDAYCS